MKRLPVFFWSPVTFSEVVLAGSQNFMWPRIWPLLSKVYCEMDTFCGNSGAAFFCPLPVTCQGGRKGPSGQPERHQGGRKGLIGQRHQGGRKGSIGQLARHQGGTREAGKNHLAAWEAPGRQERINWTAWEAPGRQERAIWTDWEAPGRHQGEL